MASRLMLLDTASLYYRAYFGVPDSLKAPDGTPVNALRGLLGFIATLKQREQAPDVVVACWDNDWRPAWRVELLDTYKTNRLAPDSADAEETPPALSAQIPLITEALELAGIPVIGAPAAEADDVIGTLAHTWTGPVDIVTGDRDLFQLIDDARDVRVLYTVTAGIGKIAEVDNAWISDKYGIDARQYADFATLRGDASDGLPGVRGIGEKTAAALLNEYGDLPAIIQAAAKAEAPMSPKRRASLLDARAYIDAARQVVAVRTDLDITIPTPLPSPDVDGLLAFGERWGATSPVSRLIAQL